MSQTVFIPGPLPGMNDFVRKHHHVYSNMKREWGQIIKARIRKARLAAVPRAVIHFRWIEPNDRRDPDNIMAAQKFILDSLVVAKVLPDDGHACVRRLLHEFIIDPTNPGVLVTVEKV